MNINLKIHSKAHIFKALLGHLEYCIMGINYPDEELIVINYHGTPAKFTEQFEKQVLFFLKHFHIINPGELAIFYKKKLKTDKPSLLFTFDDGIKNNLNAIEVLNKYNIKALFFIIPDFIDTPPELQKDYYLKNIRPEVNCLVEREPEDYSSMTWKELKEILAMGHQIGSHTFTHNLNRSFSMENSRHEILDSRKRIAKNLEIEIDKINAYCSPNNTLFSTGEKEAKLIKENYKYHFTTFPGNNFIHANPLFIKRSNIECFWLKGAILFAIGKLERRRWKKAVWDYEALAFK